ncbi:MAG: tetratricopeptide repeat protein [Elusimicrobia bacterium]|nr:tetratricopeptide repeat protein [Elusimicrobiota bacterium]
MRRALRRTALLAALAAAAVPARAWRLFGEPSDGRIRPVQALSDAGKAKQVVAALTPDFIATLRGTDLRQAYVLMGDNLQILGKPAEALGYYQLGVGLFPKNVDLLTRLGDLLHRNGLDARARPYLKRALIYEPRHWVAHIDLAQIAARDGFYEKAAAHYEVAFEAPEVLKRPDVWREYAAVLMKLGEDKTAELALRKSLELEPKSADAHVLLAFVRRDEGNVDEAALQLDQAAVLGAGVGALRAKALLLLDAGRPTQARAAAEEVLKTVPGDAAALWVVARVRLASGDYAGAAAALSRARQAAQGDGFALKADEALRDAALARAADRASR